MINLTLTHKTMKNFFLAITIAFAFSANAQSVAINNDGSTADNSAILDLKSNNQGVLVPRMTAAQRGLIATPATGLMVYQTDAPAGFYFYNGTAWTSLNGAAGANGTNGTNGQGVPTGGAANQVLAKVNATDFNTTWVTPSTGAVGGFTHYLGEPFNGGIIYYLYKGSDGLEHGLIVAFTESQAQWQTLHTFVNANRSEDGATNTSLMTGSPARTYINTLGAGWYLPSIDELTLLYYNRYSAQKGLRTGGYTLLSAVADYYSSTEFDTNGAYGFNFQLGLSSDIWKSSIMNVRGVKAF